MKCHSSPPFSFLCIIIINFNFMKTKITGLPLVALLSVILFSVSSCRSDQQKIDGFVKSINKMCPYAPNSSMRMDGAESLPDKTVQINFTLLTQMFGNDEADGAILEDSMKPIFIQMIQDESNFKSIAKLGATFVFSFRDAAGKELSKINITPEEYNSPTEKTMDFKSGKPIEDNLEPILKTVVSAIKKQLPITDPESGIRTIDCYSTGKTLTTVAELPDSFTKDLDKDEFVEATTINSKAMIKGDASMNNLVTKWVIVEYIYKKEDGSTFATVMIKPEDIR